MLVLVHVHACTYIALYTFGFLLLHVFLQTSFWVMDEVLDEENPKVRAEIVSQFIRVAKVTKFSENRVVVAIYYV